MRFVAFFLLHCSALAVLCELDETKWESFKVEHNKIYTSVEEEDDHKAVFLQTQELIEQLGTKNLSWTVDFNFFADLTQQEKQSRLGLLLNENTQPPKNNETSRSDTSRQTPSSFDYRSDGCLQPIKDQGDCGSCWAFASIAPIEFLHCRRTNKPIDLSEQQLVSCDPEDNGCAGGTMWDAWSYLKSTSSITSCAYPYTSGITKKNSVCHCGRLTPTALRTQSWGWADPQGANANVLAESLINRGPLATAMAVVDSFYSYSSGVYDDPSCDRYKINHAVVIVGYGTSTNGIPYWIVRNSWGLHWGERGYFRIRRGADRCHIEFYAMYVTLA